jgi:hypothetical protein
LEHAEGKFSMRGTKLERETAWVAEVTPTAMSDMAASREIGDCVRMMEVAAWWGI